MFELHMWPTPNAHKVTIFQEEIGLAYRTVAVHIGAGDRFRPEFLAIGPNDIRPPRPGPQNDAQREIVFGKKQFERR